MKPDRSGRGEAPIANFPRALEQLGTGDAVLHQRAQIIATAIASLRENANILAKAWTTLRNGSSHVERKLAAVFGLSLGIAGVGWGMLSSSGPRILRAANLQGSTRQGMLSPPFAAARATYARHGITNVGYWDPPENDKELGPSTLTTLHLYPRVSVERRA